MLKKIFHSGPPTSSFEAKLTNEMLLVERQRLLILAIILGITLIANTIGVLFFHQQTIQMYHDERMVLWLGVAQVAAIGYALLARAAFGYFQRRALQPPLMSRIANVFVETSLPTAILVILAVFQGPRAALQTNIVWLYTLFIILATLRLSLTLCLWTGFVAAAEYAAVWLVSGILQPELLTPGYLADHSQVTLILLLMGGGTGMVSLVIRDRVLRSLRSIEERNRIVSVFGQHVSPLVVDKLLNQKTEDDASEVRHVCMMFLDIRNFTTFSERADPVVVIGYLNALFAAMIEIINAHHGIINKFLGDGFMAVFGAPLSDGRDCQNAVAAAQAMVLKVEQMIAAGEIPPTRIGIGLHAGEAITGNVGSPLRKEYTVIGDVVNVAARIEQLNKQFASQLLISEEVWLALDDGRPQAEALEPLTVNGRVTPLQVWKLA
ncbi:MAG: adenylate/guanylate cyclase domain-containing protein [Herpetosiphonaceae bacterium]|nr:adenylate/guanylate cyclase domain-containing protein [Herpetosiphonaceae bacterium]